MKVLITGGAGFIGSHFVAKWTNGDFDEITNIRVLDNLTYSGNINNLENAKSNKNFEFIKGDILDEKLVRDVVQDVDAVLNFAAESHVDKSIQGSKIFFNTNVLGVHNLLENIIHVNKKIRFIQISTDEVYGSIKSGSWTEDSPLLPNSPYASSKAAADLLVRSFSKTYGLDTIITRSSNNFGPNQFPEKLIPVLIINSIQNKNLPLYGDGSQIREWTHVSDNCVGIYKALLLGKKGNIYNLGSGNEYTNLEVAQIIRSEIRSSSSEITFVENRKAHDFRYSVNYEKAKIELTYAPNKDFRKGIIETINWYLKNQLWWESLVLK